MAAGGGPGGFDYNQWAAMNLGKGGSEGGDFGKKWPQLIGKLIGINPDMEGHGVIPNETNVGGGLSLNNISLMKDRPGGVLASILKYFTRDLPAGLTGFMEIFSSDGSSSGGDTGAASSSSGDYNSGNAMAGGGPASMSDMPSFSGQDAGDVMVNYGGKMVSASNMVSDAMDIPETRLGNLQPPAASAVVAGIGRDGGMDIG